MFEYRKMASSGSVLGKGSIRAIVEKPLRGVPEKDRICVSTEKWYKSGSVPGKGRIRASVEKLSRGVPENGRICVSTKKWQNLGQYREKVESVQESKNCPGEFRKRVEYV